MLSCARVNYMLPNLISFKTWTKTYLNNAILYSTVIYELIMIKSYNSCTTSNNGNDFRYDICKQDQSPPPTPKPVWDVYMVFKQYLLSTLWQHQCNISVKNLGQCLSLNLTWYTVSVQTSFNVNLKLTYAHA